jgi:protein involved in polysaccharide export with SLBB domain
MTPETPDLFDTDLQQLFAGIVPDGGFEDRLVAALRPSRLRWAIPGPVAKAALAAAAVLAVGVTGYVGNRYIPGNRQIGFSLAPAPAHDGKFHKGDSFTVAVNDLVGLGVETTRQVQVNDDGTIKLPLLGPIKAEGLSEDELQKSIADAYRNGQIMTSAQVSITTAQDRESSVAALADRNAADMILGKRGRTPLRPTEDRTGSEFDNLDAVLLPYAGSDETGASNEKKEADKKGTDPLMSALSSKPEADENSSATNRASTPFAQANREAEYQQDRNRTISNLIQDSRQYVAEGKYSEAAAVINNIKKLDSSNAYANTVKPFLDDKKNIVEQRDGKTGQSPLPDLNDANEEKKPYNDVLAYPPDWPKVAEMRDKEISPGSAATPTSPSSNTRKANDSFFMLKDGTKVNVTVDQSGEPVKTVLAGSDQKDWLTIEGDIPLAAIATVNASQPATTQPALIDDRKIIRTGTMEFDVDRFDTAQMQISKIVGELGGFVGATDSTKLPNGKVRGSIAVRIPPGHLDTLVLSLRALGDLKSQQITAADITKEYTDIESELAADRAMQDRLLDLIHNGKGTVKDLLAAENELGTWRTKIEKAEGMIRYYNAQVAMSTLTITLSEKDIQTPAAAVETETADMGIEAVDVEAARTTAMKSIDDAKGRIVSAELKRFDAGQLAAKLVADVPPESAGAVIDQLKLIGKVARLEIERQQNTTDGSPLILTTADAVTSDYKIENADLLTISVNDLVGVGVTTTKDLQVDENGEVTLPLLGKIKAAGLTTADLQKAIADAYKNKQVITNAQVSVKVKGAHGQAGTNPALSAGFNPVRTDRKPTRLLISIYNLANVAPRRTTNVNLAATDVEAAYSALSNLAKSTGGRVVTANLDRNDPVRTTGSLVLEFPAGQLESTLTTLRDQGEVLKLTATENPDTQNSTEAKQGLTVLLVSLASVPARESIQQTLAAVDVAKAYQAIVDAVNSPRLTIHQGGVSVTATVPASHGRVQSAQLNEQDRQNVTADLQLEIPRLTEADFDNALTDAGVSISRTSTQAINTDNAVDSKVQVHLTITSADHLPARETTKLQVEVPDVDKAAGAAQALAIAQGGRVLESSISRDKGKGTARLVLDVPLEKAGEALQQLRDAGTVRAIDSSRDPQAPAGQFAHAIIGVEFATGDAIVADQTGPWAAVRQGLSTSITGLLWSLQWIVVGLCLIGPWLLLGWGGLKLMRLRSGRTSSARP